VLASPRSGDNGDGWCCKYDSCEATPYKGRNQDGHCQLLVKVKYVAIFDNEGENIADVACSAMSSQ